MSALANPVIQREVNFGGNLTWQTRCYRPASEAEVLDILAWHATGRIRVLGSKHSWSDIAVSGEASLDMSRFDEGSGHRNQRILRDVQPFALDGQGFVRVGAGSTLQRLLDRLHRATDQTLPTLGVIKKQTISGAISTGTHGSGRQSLSHFVTRVRLAAYDPDTGQPMIRGYTDGDELRAARCGLGSIDASPTMSSAQSRRASSAGAWMRGCIGASISPWSIWTLPDIAPLYPEWRRSASRPAVTIQVALFGMTARRGSWDSRPVVWNRLGSRFDREASSWRPGRAWIHDVNQSKPNRPHCEACSTAPWPPDNTVNLGHDCASSRPSPD